MMLVGSMTQVEALALCYGTCFAGIWYPMVWFSGGGDMKEHARTRSHLAVISTSDAFVLLPRLDAQRRHVTPVLPLGIVSLAPEL